MSTKWIIGDGTPQEEAAAVAAYMHRCAAVAEGLCPEHRTILNPLDMGNDVVAGHCPSCGVYWWYDPEAGRLGSMTDHDPATGNWRPPYRSLA